MAVNAFLWRASLDTVSFIPIDIADPIGGVISTEWYLDPEKINERIKINIYLKVPIAKGFITPALGSVIDCGTSEAIDKVMEGYTTELPFATYVSIIMIPPGNLLRGKTTLYIDPRTGSWTEVFELPTAQGPNLFGLEKCII